MSREEEQSVWDHLEELAQRLRKALFAVVVVTMAVIVLPSDYSNLLRLDFSNYTPLVATLMGFIQDSLLPADVTLIAFNWLDTFYIYFLLAMVVGVIITLPYLAYELYQFIKPAMYPHERRSVYSFIFAVTFLFVTGAVYAWFILLPTTFTVLSKFVYQSRVVPFFSVKGFFDMVAFGLFGSGLFFTFPIIIWMLVKADLLEVQTLKDNRKQLFAVLLIVTAILTPDPTPFSMLLMSIPFYLLYELTIQILSRVIKKRDPYDYILVRGVNASRELLEKGQVGESVE
jgi:sec-independent protein translocase protein TatC